MAVATALCPGRSTILASGTGARLLNSTSLTVTATAFPVAPRPVPPALPRNTIRGQPRSEHAVRPVSRSSTFHACFPIPSAGSPRIASGTLMASWLAWHGGDEAAGPYPAGRSG